MEKRGFVERTEYGADGRRAAENAIEVHAGNIRRHALDSLTPEQAAVIRAWSQQTVERLQVGDS